MGDNLRRIYIYPRLPKDDGPAANLFWPPGMAGLPVLPDDQSRPTSPDYPESYFAQGGGLLGMLLRGMQQGQGQSGVDSSSAPNGADGNGSPQGGLLGRLLALQAEQSQPPSFAETNEPTPSESPDPNFREVSRARRAAGPQGTTGNRSDDQSPVPYTPAGGAPHSSACPNCAQRDLAGQPERTFADRLQAWWDHPTPYGVVARVKEGLNGIAQAVQGSIDATSVPSTEEEAFRQNLGRAQGPIGAWQVVSQFNPRIPRGAGEIPARPLINAIVNQGLRLRPGEPIARQGIDGPIAGPGVSLGNAHPPTRFQNSSALGNGLGPLQDILSSSPPQTIPRVSGGLLRTYGDGPALPWIDAPGVQPGIGEIQAGRKRYRGPPLPKGVNLLGWFEKQLPREPYGSKGGLGGGLPPRTGVKGDPDDPCNDMFIKEQNKCFERLDKEEYADVSHFRGCMKRAAERWDLCNRTGRIPIEPKEWGPDDEEIFNRDFRLR
jgi:hypothetical protein